MVDGAPHGRMPEEIPAPSNAGPDAQDTEDNHRITEHDLAFVRGRSERKVLRCRHTTDKDIPDSIAADKTAYCRQYIDNCIRC